MTDRTWVGGHDGNNVLSADIQVADLGSLSVSAIQPDQYKTRFRAGQHELEQGERKRRAHLL
jgi:hypothetical protein